MKLFNAVGVVIVVALLRKRYQRWSAWEGGWSGAWGN